MNRRLVLIANSGSKNNYLPGVAIDMRHYYRYFRMAEGGAWRSYEIQTFDNSCTKESLKKYIDEHRSYVDYFQIIFCGHGYALDNNNTILELLPNNDCSVSEIKQWLQGKYGLIIVDCCRKVYPSCTYMQDCAIEELSSLRESADVSYREVCRKIYIQSLNYIKEKYPHGYIAEAYSCSLGECAHDDDVMGGYYSYSLLHQALKNIKHMKGQHSVLSSKVGLFSTVHDTVCPIVNAKSLLTDHVPQHPKRIYGAKIPFYVVPILNEYVQKQEKKL